MIDERGFRWLDLNEVLVDYIFPRWHIKVRLFDNPPPKR